MFHNKFRSIPETHQGFIALILGFILFFGALGKLGFLQSILNLIMVLVGLYLLLWGLDHSNLWKSIKGLRRK
ncbi:MAG TPA: hypothetical protein VLG50_02055 [Candidatus Saccharimonadales bacterium]|nr:hypothetical protein [Candidatus Saccharimonadales bacterium]